VIGARARVANPPRAKVRVLVSYWYWKNTDIREVLQRRFGADPPPVFADSGAFSAKNFKATIDPGEYADWLHKYRDLFTVYANLDVKGDLAAGLRNQDYLEKRGLQPLPVFHAGEPLEALEEMAVHYPYLAIGGVAREFGKNWSPPLIRWFTRCFSATQGRSAVHGFGITHFGVMRMFPWYSLDSSTWRSGARFGAYAIFDDQIERDFITFDVQKQKRWLTRSDLLRSYGFDPADFYDRRRFDYRVNAVLTVLSYVRAEDYMRRTFGVVQGSCIDPGPNIYLVTPHDSFDGMQAIAAARLRWEPVACAR